MKKTDWKLPRRELASALALTLGVIMMGAIQTNAAPVTSANSLVSTIEDIKSPTFVQDDFNKNVPGAGSDAMNISSPYFVSGSDIKADKITSVNNASITRVPEALPMTVSPIVKAEIAETFKLAGYEMPEFAVLEPIEVRPDPVAIMVMGSIVTKEDLEKAKQENGHIVIQTTYYSWTIDAGDIADDGLKDIDLGVNIVEIPTVQPAIIHKISNGNPVKQISLNYHGMFGFTGTLKVNVGSQSYGKHGNLFHCMDDGRVEFISSVPIETNGDVNLRFGHASDYLLVMSDEPMSQASVPEELRPLESGDASIAGSESVNQTETQLAGNTSQSMAVNNQMKSVKTGDHDVVLPWMISGISALGIMLYLLKRKKA